MHIPRAVTFNPVPVDASKMPLAIAHPIRAKKRHPIFLDVIFSLKMNTESIMTNIGAMLNNIADNDNDTSPTASL